MGGTTGPVSRAVATGASTREVALNGTLLLNSCANGSASEKPNRDLDPEAGDTQLLERLRQVAVGRTVHSCVCRSVQHPALSKRDLRPACVHRKETRALSPPASGR
jgi:hypothetical protein